MSAEEGKGGPGGWTTMKIDPEIFEELGVRDPEELKREMAISKRIRQVRKELKDNPDSVELQLELGRLFIDGGDLDEATKQLKQIITRDSKNASAYKLLGTAYAMSNHEDEAIRELTRASELLPNDSEIHLNLGAFIHILEHEYTTQV